MSTPASASVPEPRFGLFVTSQEIAEAKQRAATQPAAKAFRERTLKIADEWLARPDQWIRDIMPAPGSKFAYGTAGCPHCGKKWTSFGKSVASFDRPYKLVCPHCETVFDVKNPSGPYVDSGNGVVVGGRRFWIQGVWNGFVVNEMWAAFNPDNGALVNLANAYALTGDERYARKAIVMMDALATLTPKTRGPRDFDVNLDSDTGRMQHLTSIVFRAQVHFARALDLLGEHPALQEKSPTNPEKTIWDNIRYGIFEEYLFVPINTRNGRLHSLHNHEADSVRALIVAGIIYGNPEYLRWGAQGFQAFLDNVIDRDGLYYETSLSYTEFTRTVFIDMAELLMRYDPSKYSAAQKMPQRNDLPYNGNFFNHENFARLILDTPERLSLLGRQPTYGNSKFDLSVWKTPGRTYNRLEFQQALRVLEYSSNPQRRAQAASKVATLWQFARSEPIEDWWAFYRVANVGSDAKPDGGNTEPEIAEPTTSDFFGLTGLMMLRAGEGEHRRGVVLRAGMNMPHAHDDQLGLLLFSHGRALSGDIGYGTFGNHTHLGWASRSVAHHKVVVNQDETNDNRMFRLGPGGTIHRFHQGAGISLAEADLTAMYPASDGVRDYRRTLLQIDLSPTASYWVDLFDVDGGRVHDYAMHMRPLGEQGSFSIEGASPQQTPGVWTLAALDPKHRDASFNQPGRSWGERLTVNGMIAKLPGVEDEVPEKGQWYATPGNGYGFLYDVKQLRTERPWSATWRWKEAGEKYGLRLQMLPETPQQVITALGPTLNGDNKMQFVVARNGQPEQTDDIRTRYAAVLESFGEVPQLSQTEALRQNDRIIGLRVRAPEMQREDVILDARHGAITQEKIPALDAGLAVISRQNGELSTLLLSGGSALTADGIGLRFNAPQWKAKIASVNEEANTFRLSQPLPSSVRGSLLTVNNPAYEHGSAYRFGGVSSDGDISPLNSGLTLASSQVAALQEDGFEATAPLVFGYEYKTDTRFLNGKHIVSGGKTGHVTGMRDFKYVTTKGMTPQPGETFTVFDVQTGDDVLIHSTATLSRQSDGSWILQSNLPVTASFSWPFERAVGDQWVRQTGNQLLVTPEILGETGTVRFRAAR